MLSFFAKRVAETTASAPSADVANQQEATSSGHSPSSSSDQLPANSRGRGGSEAFKAAQKRETSRHQEHVPCYKESQASLKCLSKNDYSYKACQQQFQDYKDCKTLWAKEKIFGKKDADEAAPSS